MSDETSEYEDQDGPSWWPAPEPDWDNPPDLDIPSHEEPSMHVYDLSPEDAAAQRWQGGPVHHHLWPSKYRGAEWDSTPHDDAGVSTPQDDAQDTD